MKTDSAIVTGRSIAAQGVAWLLLPTLIWLLFWLRLWIGVPVALLAVVASVSLLRRIPEESDFSDVIRDRKYYFVMGAAALFVFFSGIGGLWYQVSGDAHYRNAILYELSKNPWPVAYYGDSGISLMTYFFGSWLPAALVGRITGSYFAGSIALFLYFVWGIWIIFNLLFSRFGGRANWTIFLVFVFLSGWDDVVWLIMDFNATSFVDYIITQKDIASGYYHSNCDYSLFVHTFNQAYPAMIGLLLLLRLRRSARALLMVPALIFIGAAFPTVVIFPLAVFFFFSEGRWKRAFSWQNVVALVVLLLEGIFFMGNNAGATPVSSSGMAEWSLAEAAVVFIFFTYGVFLPWIWKSVRRDPVFWILAVPMVFAPALSLGGTPDFGWRLGVPFALYFMLIMMDRILKLRGDRSADARCLRGVIAVGVISPLVFYLQFFMIPALHVAGRDDVMLKVKKRYYFQWQAYSSLDSLHNPADRCYNNFYADGESLFTKYLMRRDTAQSSGR